MFQFTTTTIINSNQAVDAQGNDLLDNEGAKLTKFAGDADKLRVFGTGIFKAENIKSVYKRASSKGVREVSTITIPEAAANTLLRLEVNVKLHGRVQSDYTSYNGDFSKPAVIDIISSGTPANDAAEFARLYNKLKTEYGYSMFTAKAAGATLTLTARENGQIIHAELFEVAELDKNLVPVITSLAKSKVTQSGKRGFGDTAHMLQSIAIPTYENTRHFGILKDERPIVGAAYTQFTLKYDVPFGEEGVWLANNRSVTTHVFWVIDSLAAAFEAEIVKAFADVEPVTDDPKDNHTSNPGGAPGNDDDEPVTEG